ncbi:ankyrin repeat-containing domain protein [Mycena epipterygia]|nr:ankyrin repeat-containing domain protein [Mycena epipterygia]
MSSCFRVRQRLKGFFGGKKNHSRPSTDTISAPLETVQVSATAPRLPDQLQTSTSPASKPIGKSVSPANDPPVTGAKSTLGSELVIDNIALTLNLVENLAGFFQTVPFIAPVAGLMSEILKIYQEVKDTNDKREALLAQITDISHDLCATVLRMEATNHRDLVGRLKADVETYTELLEKASIFVKEYDKRSVISRGLAHTQLGNELSALKEELDSFGARFRTNRLVDLAINQNIISETVNKIYEMAVIEKIQKWLGPPPEMGKKQHDTLELLKEGTGRWLLDGNEVMEWQDNPGALWIRGDSGSGKSVLSSAVIKKLTDDQELLQDLGKPPAVAFFYFDFKNKEGHAVENALQRIVLQLSAHSPYGYRALNKRYELSKGQTLPTYQELQDILQELLLELGCTYIVLDGLDECQDAELDKLVDLVLMLQGWTRSALHFLITSQPRTIFADSFGAMTCISLASELTEQDIRSFLDDELQSNRYRLKTWASRPGGPNIPDITSRIVQKSNGMFRLAACLLVELSRCKWQQELEETLENLPDDLFGIYNRFLERIRKKDLVYVAGALRWMMFSQNWQWNMYENPSRIGQLDVLADAIAFDFSDLERHTYDPSRREDNTLAIVEWLEGLVTISDHASGARRVVLAHASVQDYLLSTQFTNLTGFDLSDKLSHTFLAESCIGYLLHFADHPLDWYGSYPCAEYAATYWSHHVLRSHDQSILLDNTMRLLKDGSPQYIALNRLRTGYGPRSWVSPIPALSLCSEEGYTDGVRALLKNGAEINIHECGTSPLVAACRRGHTETVRLLLENGATIDGHELNVAGSEGHADIVNLLLEKSNLNREKKARALKAACCWGYVDVVRFLLQSGAAVNGLEEEDESPLQVAASMGRTEIVGLLLEKGANANAESKRRGSALQAACHIHHAGIVRLLLENGADAKGHKEEESPLYGAASNGDTDIVGLLLEKGTDANVASALKAACSGGYTEIVQLLLASGADVNGHEEEDGSPFEVAMSNEHMEIALLLLQNGANVNTQGDHDEYVSALQATYREVYAMILLEKGIEIATDDESQGAIAYTHADMVRLLLENGIELATDDELQDAIAYIHGFELVLERLGATTSTAASGPEEE